MGYEIQKRVVRSSTIMFPYYDVWVVWDRRDDFIHFVDRFESEEAAKRLVRKLKVVDV